LSPLPFEVEAAIFRVVQESLTNIYRHSGSKMAELEVTRNSQKVHVKIRDYGNGHAPGQSPDRAPGGAPKKFDPQQVGVGISGMRERVRGLGGEFRIYDAEPGTAVEVDLPIARSMVKAPAGQK